MQPNLNIADSLELSDKHNLPISNSNDLFLQFSVYAQNIFSKQFVYVI